MKFRKLNTKVITESTTKNESLDGYVRCRCSECGTTNRVHVTFEGSGMPFNETTFSCENCGAVNNCYDPHTYDENGYITEDVDELSTGYASAIQDRKKNKEQFSDTMQELHKDTEEFVEENQKREIKTETTKEMKTMHLSEDLFSPIAESGKFTEPENLGKGCCAPTLYIPDGIEETVEYAQGVGPRSRVARNNLKMLIDTLAAQEQDFDDFDAYWKAHYAAGKTAINNAREIITGESQPIVEEDIEVVKPKRVRGKNEKKWIGDYSSEDLWLAVYDELSATLDNEGKGQQVDKQIKARRGERYEKVFPHGDNDIIIYAPTLDDFAFAKRVADHYGVVAEEPREDKNKRSNSFYKYSMVIRIPADKLYKSA